GSDFHIYPPMSDMLNKWGIECFDGFNPERIRKDDIVIIGNAISRGNPEAEHVLNERIPYLSMTEALYTYFLRDKEVIAVCGTHGKTTTTALLSHILKTAGEDPSCFVGGVMVNYDSNFFLGNGKYFVIEGDEYDSAFFEKTPKFIRYRPSHLILSALEFDHADIYNNLDEILLWFRRLVNMIPANGRIVYNNEYPALVKAVEKSLSHTISFGDGGESGWDFLGYEGDYDKIRVWRKGFTVPDIDIILNTYLSGRFNYSNICSAVIMAIEMGIDHGKIKDSVRQFQGVKRRQEMLYSHGNIRIIEDFAHHPTAISAVLKMVREKYAESNIIALYEPRSATARRNIFQ
ncbi:MAG: UDP-N-acetylmuramate--L-alanine ligase, partial [Spirochaetota bacterium]